MGPLGRKSLEVGRLVELVAYELLSPPRRRLRRVWPAWRRGFLSESLTLYGTQHLTDDLYVSDYERYVLSPAINGELGILLDNKLAFHLMMEHLGSAGERAPRVPSFLGVVTKGRFRGVGRHVDKGGLGDLLRAVSSVVVKPLQGKEGRGVLILTATENSVLANGHDTRWDRLDDEIAARDTDIVMEFADQAKYAVDLFPPTTNTIRALTMLDPASGAVFMPAAVHRIGTTASGPVDNWTRGGLAAAVDVDTGELGPAATFSRSGPLAWHETHPDSGTRIAGTPVPRWNAVKAELLDIARRLPFLPCVGWDVVVTDDGFRVLEGNNRLAARIFQIHRPLLADDRVRRFLEYHGVLRRGRRRRDDKLWCANTG